MKYLLLVSSLLFVTARVGACEVWHLAEKQGDFVVPSSAAESIIIHCRKKASISVDPSNPVVYWEAAYISAFAQNAFKDLCKNVTYSY